MIDDFTVDGYLLRIKQTPDGWQAHYVRYQLKDADYKPTRFALPVVRHQSSPPPPAAVSFFAVQGTLHEASTLDEAIQYAWAGLMEYTSQALGK